MGLLLRDKLALVTGGGGNTGNKICAILAKEGATVIVADCSSLAADNTLRTLSGQKHISVVLDVTNLQNVSSAFDKIQKTFKRSPSILVNCIDIVEESLNQDMTVECFQDILSFYLTGIFAVIKVASSALIKEKQPGSIINIISEAGRESPLGRIFYSMSKTAVDALTKSVAKEIGKHNIWCNVITSASIDSSSTLKEGNGIISTYGKLIYEPEEI